MSPEERSLLDAVLAEPDDDLPRLLYADFIEENAETVACGKCKFPGMEPLILQKPPPLEERFIDGKRYLFEPAGTASPAMLAVTTCPDCHDSGVVSDGRRERAEFIRVQVELAAWGDCTLQYFTTQAASEMLIQRPRYQKNDRDFMMSKAYPTGRERYESHQKWKYDLLRREAELFTAKAYGHSPTGLGAARSTGYFGHLDSHQLAIYRRGFVSEVRLTLQQFVGGACERCDGTGTLGTSTDETGCPDCVPSGRKPGCHGTGRTPGCAKEVFANHPVERVVLTDREPYRAFPDGPWRWQNQFPDMASYLPPEIWKASWQVIRLWKTAELAKDALSAACVSYGIATRST